MTNINLVKYFSFFVLSIFLFGSCLEPTSPSIEQPVSAPSQKLPAHELMKIEGISSIHFVEYDSVARYDSILDTAFYPLNEYFIDSTHVKHIQYSGDNHYWYVTVYDLIKNIVWIYYDGKITIRQLATWPTNSDYELYVQTCLGSAIYPTGTFVRTEYVDNKLCNLFVDSTGRQEWTWIEHRFPLQERIEVDGFTGTFRKIVLEINVLFPDSTFAPHQLSGSFE